MAIENRVVNSKTKIKNHLTESTKPFRGDCFKPSSDEKLVQTPPEQQSQSQFFPTILELQWILESPPAVDPAELTSM